MEQHTRRKVISGIGGALLLGAAHVIDNGFPSFNFSTPPKASLPDLPALPSSNPQTRAPVKTSTQLKHAIENVVDSYRSQGVLRSVEKVQYDIRELRTGTHLAANDENKVIHMASMCKLYSAVAFMRRVEAGELSFGENSKHAIRGALQYSSNGDADWLTLNAGGPKAVESYFKENGITSFRMPNYINTEANARLNPKKNSDGGYKSAHLEQLLITPEDHTTFIQKLFNKEWPGSDTVWQYMKHERNHHNRLLKGTQWPQGAVVRSKTGTSGYVIADSGWVGKDIGGKNYVSGMTIAVMVDTATPKNKNASSIGFQNRVNPVIRAISSEVYKHLRDS